MHHTAEWQEEEEEEKGESEAVSPLGPRVPSVILWAARGTVVALLSLLRPWPPLLVLFQCSHSTL